MSNQKSVSELITFFLDKYHSGEFSKIDCNFTLHKKDDQIQKLQSALLEEKQKVRELLSNIDLARGIIHGEFCGFEHANICIDLDELIKKYGDV